MFVRVLLLALVLSFAASAQPALVSYYCDSVVNGYWTSQCDRWAQGTDYDFTIWVHGACDNSYTPHAGINVYAYSCTYEAWTQGSATGFTGGFGVAGYIVVDTYSYTYWGYYPVHNEENCNGNRVAYGTGFGFC